MNNFKKEIEQFKLVWQYADWLDKVGIVGCIFGMAMCVVAVIGVLITMVYE
jgi:hypothetical protein